MKRRDFIKYGMGGLATLVVGTKMPWLMDNPAYAAVQTQNLNFTITDAVKEMVTHEPGNNQATCYFWIYRSNSPAFPPDCPGPQIYTTVGDTINISITNELDEDHALFIPGMYNSGPIAPGATVTGTFRPNRAGSYLYYDNLNTPVNRVMGLHGALIVMPANLHGTRAGGSHRLTPYDRPTPAVQQLFDDFGRAPWWPGLAWEQGDPAANPPTPPFRQYVWLNHQASPVLFNEVGNAAPGTGARIPANFMDGFISDPFIATSNDPRLLLTVPAVPLNDTFNRLPHFFTICGQSGHFSHNHPAITPMNRVGEPCVVHVLNAGLWTHSMHLHANHFYITCVNGRVQSNLLWVDTFTSKPMDIYDMVIPYMRPPDIPNVRGIGRADAGLPAGLGTTWPPQQEFDVHQPKVGTTKISFLNPGTLIDIAQRQSPLVYPMHDHSEASQTAQGGNYNCGLIAGMTIIGDRNTPGWREFPRDADFDMMLTLGNGAPVTKPGGGTDP
jgi:FtsP/CotA-like multicopper oxidase with cupredoxin domain